MKHTAIALALWSVLSYGHAETVSTQAVVTNSVEEIYSSQELVDMAVQKKDARNAPSEQIVERYRIQSEGVLVETDSQTAIAPDATKPAPAPAAAPAPVQAVRPAGNAVATQPPRAQAQPVASIPVPAVNDQHSQPYKGNDALADSMYGGGVGQVRAVGSNVPPAGAKRGVASQNLPGVGVMPGDSPELENNVIRVSTDRTQIVNISGTLTNRVATPFAKPKAILLDGEATVKAVGQSLYIAPNGNPAPISLYVTGSATNDPVVSLTLVPKSMPPQTIVLQMDGPANPSVGDEPTSGRKDNAKSDVYTEAIVSTLRSLALGKVPEGYAEGLLPKAVANMGNVVAIPLARYSGPFFDVYRYRVEAIVPGALEMEESAFWTKGVRAVAFYPSGVVARNKPTQVFVVADKTATEARGMR